MKDTGHVARLLENGGYPTGKQLLDAMLADDDYDCGCGARDRLLELRGELATHEHQAPMVNGGIPWGSLVGLAKSFIRSCSAGEGRLLASEKLARALKCFHAGDYGGVIDCAEEVGFTVEIADDN